LVNFPQEFILTGRFKMNRIRSSQTIVATVLLSLLPGFTGFAQLPAGGSAMSLNSAMLKLFGSTTAFTARADVQVLDPSQAERIRTPMTFASLDGKLRVEIDMSQMHGKDLAPAAVAGLKQLGMDRVVSLLRTDKKVMYIIYPNAQSYVSLPLPKEETGAANQNLKVEKTALAKETVDGHPCVKNGVVVKSGAKVILTATTWNASDLKDFPVQIVTKEKDMTSIMRFQQILFVRLDAKQFEPPAGFKPYSDPETLVVAQSKKIPGAPKK
jgi:hypothetical protein